MKGDIKKKYLDNYDNIVQKRLSGIQVKDIAKEYGIGERILRAYLNQDGIKIRKSIFDYDIEDIILDYQNGMLVEDLQRKYKISWDTIKPILKKNHIHLRDASEAKQKYHINQNYFDSLDTPNKAYILGLLYSDGNISNNHISICLQEGDKHILEDISKELEYNGKLYYIDYTKYNKKDNFNRKNQWNLNITNKRLAENLIRYGVVPNKSLIIEFPYFIDDNLFSHFLRGLSDGDGCIAKNESRWNICGSGTLMKPLKNYIESHVNVHCSITPDKRKNNFYNIRVSGTRQVRMILDYMYLNADLKLNRKYELYLSKYKEKIA